MSIDVTCPVHKKVEITEEEKIKKYQDLAREIGKLWNLKVIVTPVVTKAFRNRA